VLCWEYSKFYGLLCKETVVTSFYDLNVLFSKTYIHNIILNIIYSLRYIIHFASDGIIWLIKFESHLSNSQYNVCYFIELISQWIWKESKINNIKLIFREFLLWMAGVFKQSKVFPYRFRSVIEYTEESMEILTNSNRWSPGYAERKIHISSCYAN